MCLAWLKVCVLVCTMCASLLWLGATALGAPHIRLKGRAQLDVHLSRESGVLVVAGTVTDDVARPLPDFVVGITVVSPANEQGSPIPLLADSGGRFLARLTLPGAAHVLRIEANSSALVDGAKVEIPIDVRLRPLNLRFDPEPAGTIALGLDEEGVSLEAVASIEDEGLATVAHGMPLSLSNEAGEFLDASRTDGSGRARFQVDSIRLGRPGAGEVRVRFAGDEMVAASSHTMRVERWTRVDLAFGDTAERPVVDWQDESMVIRIVAAPRCARRGCQGTPSGAVEARRGGNKVLGVAPLHNGVARFVTPKGPQPDEIRGALANSIPLSFRYIPDAPWFRSGEELTFTRSMEVTSPWRKLPLAFVAIAVIAWLAFLRIPIGTVRREPSDVLSGVELVRPGLQSHGWTGRVTDVHDGVPVPDARLSVERAGFEGVQVLTETLSDVTGAFVLPPVESRPSDVLVVEGRLHANLRRALPPSGEIVVALVLRKRALLDRLVAWARRRGTPYDMTADPTPGHVREAAGSDLVVARWADAVETAAYAGGDVDKQGQTRVDTLAPPSEADDVDVNRSRSL
jgi:hypothetical protein